MFSDIDECLDANRCQHGCVNIIGSYHCTCEPGYQLSVDQRTCEGQSLNYSPILKIMHAINFGIEPFPLLTVFGSLLLYLDMHKLALTPICEFCWMLLYTWLISSGVNFAVTNHLHWVSLVKTFLVKYIH